MIRAYQADWIYPVTSPPIHNGFVIVENDTIIDLLDENKANSAQNFSGWILIPGLVNCHTHLDLAAPTKAVKPDCADPTPWLKSVIQQRMNRTNEDTETLIQENLHQVLQSGCCLLGDISASGRSAGILAKHPIEAICFFEVLGLSKERANHFLEEAKNWLAQMNLELTTLGISPHAPYSTSRELFDWAMKLPVPFASHFMEFQTESDLIVSQQGPFVSFLKDRGAWHPESLLLQSEYYNLLNIPNSAPRIWVHMNNSKANRLPEGHGVVHCPRTHSAFGHSLFPFEEWFESSVPVGLGTDSLASNPDLDIWNECQFLLDHRQDLCPSKVLEMATIQGAKVLGKQQEYGSIEIGKKAAFTMIPCRKSMDDPIQQLRHLENTARRYRIWHGNLETY